jgi:2Fe-2S ferredoxin
MTFVFPDGEPDIVVDVDPDKLPCQRDGLSGSVLDVALGAGIAVDHACGGVCACSTCHVVVQAGFDSCNESSDREEEELDYAPGLTPNSRLGCQCVPDGSIDVVVKVPSWNRNYVKEAHH